MKYLLNVILFLICLIVSPIGGKNQDKDFYPDKAGVYSVHCDHFSLPGAAASIDAVEFELICHSQSPKPL